ncbi:MAG: hypothetical protein A2073_02800 [Deltaproteobacteria bacterium GWC2_42_11]|nr:MAG: hypothetical protein A2073_02800 [Deltaproteobacteria bacterium GWC2_42_11]HBO83800.1 hypothetical protein [Deltaproteobacteria bacterium]
MVKRFFIIAILAVITLNVNFICHSVHMDRHGRSGHVSSTDTCPIKGACPHHNNDNHEHNGHHKADKGTFIKCSCSADYTSTIAYEIIMQNNSIIIMPQFFAYNLTENKQIFSSREPIPSEGPPRIIA